MKRTLTVIDALVRATDMPRTIILGEAPGGLNVSGESELRAWYDFVASQQPQKLTPPINRLLEVIFAIRSNKNETVPTEWTIEYAPLWQPSEQEKATTAKTVMDLAQKCFRCIVLTFSVAAKIHAARILEPEHC